MKVPPEINVRRPGAVLVVGRDPGEYEMAYRYDEEREVHYPSGRPFVGPAGKVLERIGLSALGMPRHEVNFANVVGYQPSEDDFTKHDPQAVAEGVLELHRLIEMLHPSLIIALGNEASHALVEEWPSSRTKGLTVYGAKGIEDRRGYFWDTRWGTVLTTLHPAGVARKKVPGEFLLETDFRRARRWLDGKLPRDKFPEIRRLRSHLQAQEIMASRLVGWDIETKWDTTADLCHGFCGDDYQPHVAVCDYEYVTYGEQILLSPVPKVGHNGPRYDVPAMRVFRNLRVNNYAHDTQQMWWALEPDIAGTDEAGGEEVEIRAASKMTRKGLAFLCSLFFNLPWWKVYPENDDPDYLEKMVQINGNDAFTTRWLADCLLAEIEQENVQAQYRQAVNLFPVLVELHLRGLRVDDVLRQKRHEALTKRHEALREQARQAALPYIIAHDVAKFRKLRKCDCCGGGKTQRIRCDSCYFAEWPEYPGKPTKDIAIDRGFKTIKALKEAFGTCQICEGTGRIKKYDFNPYSEDQLKVFLYEVLGVPKSTWKGKVRTDQTALKKIIRWAKGE